MSALTPGSTAPPIASPTALLEKLCGEAPRLRGKGDSPAEASLPAIPVEAKALSEALAPPVEPSHQASDLSQLHLMQRNQLIPDLCIVATVCICCVGGLGRTHSVGTSTLCSECSLALNTQALCLVCPSSSGSFPLGADIWGPQKYSHHGTN